MRVETGSDFTMGDQFKEVTVMMAMVVMMEVMITVMCSPRIMMLSLRMAVPTKP